MENLNCIKCFRFNDQIIYLKCGHYFCRRCLSKDSNCNKCKINSNPNSENNNENLNEKKYENILTNKIIKENYIKDDKSLNSNYDFELKYSNTKSKNYLNILILISILFKLQI